MDTFAELNSGTWFASRIRFRLRRLAGPFLLDRSLGRRECLEPFVGDRFAAYDRASERSRRQALLGAGNRRQLFAEIVGPALVELVLEEVRREVRRVGVVGQLAVVQMAEVAELLFDPAPLGGQQFARVVSVHDASLRRQVTAPPPEEAQAL